MSGSKTALVTNACGFARSPAVAALLEAGFAVLAHDTVSQTSRSGMDSRRDAEA